MVLVDGEGRPLGEVTADRLAEGTVTAADARQIGPTVTTTVTMREALSLMMTDSLRPLLVLDADGRVAGYVSIELINRALHSEASHARRSSLHPDPARRDPVTEAQ